METKKLTRTDWLELALAELMQHGYGALKAQRLAQKLNVTRGSFYYHFESLDAFHEAVMQHWSRRTTQQLIADLRQNASPMEALHMLLSITLRSGERLERAMRSWATVDGHVAKQVEKIDEERIAFTERLLQDCGVAPTDASSRARLLYWAAIGRLMMPFPDSNLLEEDQVSEIAALMLAR